MMFYWFFTSCPGFFMFFKLESASTFQRILILSTFQAFPKKLKTVPVFFQAQKRKPPKDCAFNLLESFVSLVALGDDLNGIARTCPTAMKDWESEVACQAGTLVFFLSCGVYLLFICCYCVCV